MDYAPWSIGVDTREFSSIVDRTIPNLFISNFDGFILHSYMYLGQRGAKFEGRYRETETLMEKR